MGKLLTAKVGKLLTRLLGNYLTATLGKVLDIYNRLSLGKDAHRMATVIQGSTKEE